MRSLSLRPARRPLPLTRRRLLATSGMLSAAMLAACGGDSTDEARDVGSAPNRDAGVVAGGHAPDATPQPGGTLSVPWPLTPPLDPVTNTTFTVQRLASLVYPRLLKFKTGVDPRIAQNYETVPDLAASQPEVLDDGLRYVVKLRPDARSHPKPPLNGRPYTSADVKASYERFVNEPTNVNRGIYASAGVQAVETPDPTTVIYRLAKPYAPFLPLLANSYFWVLPQEAGTGFDPAREMIGCGPFIFESNEPDIALRFRKHPEYFLSGQPYVDSLTLPIIAEPAQERGQFQAQRLDIIGVAHEFVSEIRAGSPQATIIAYPSTTFPLMYGQQRGSGPFTDERVRQALSLAVDRDALLQVSYDGKGWWQNIVPVALGKWWTDPKDAANRPSTRFFGTGDRNKDVAEAVALLKAAGYDESRPLPVKYYFTPNAYGDSYNQWAEATAGFLKETNVFQPSIFPADYRGEWVATGGYWFGTKVPEDGIAFGLEGVVNDAHDYVYNLLHSKSTRNRAGINDPELDAMIDREVVTLDQNEREKTIKAIVARANEKAYYAPIMVGPAYFALQPRVKGYTLSVTYGWGSEALSNVFLTQ